MTTIDYYKGLAFREREEAANIAAIREDADTSILTTWEDMDEWEGAESEVFYNGEGIELLGWKFVEREVLFDVDALGDDTMEMVVSDIEDLNHPTVDDGERARRVA